VFTFYRNKVSMFELIWVFIKVGNHMFMFSQGQKISVTWFILFI